MDEIESVLTEYSLAEENILITETAKNVQAYLKETWSQFNSVLEVPLRDIFPDPGKGGLQSIWRHGSADIVVYYGKKIVAIFEPGGSHHFNDPKQIRRDKRKWKLCQINDVRCFRFANNLPTALSKRKMRAMFGKFLFGMKTE